MSTAYGNNRFSKIRVFSGAQLKYIAFLSMLIDHVNKAFANRKWIFEICERCIWYFGFVEDVF